jgi:hypothetical protein
MNCPDRRSPSPFLLDSCYWQERISNAQKVPKRLLILPRPDLSGPAADVIEWRLRTHDQQRLWGLRGLSPFHPDPKGALLCAVSAAELPQVDPALLAEGQAHFVYQVPAGRRLEDRVLDALRVLQTVLELVQLTSDRIHLIGQANEDEPDEFMILRRLQEAGLSGALAGSPAQ